MRLGPDYRFETELLADGPIDEGRLKTLYVRGKGDPSITTERLYGIVDRDLLYAQGMAAVGQPMSSHLAARLARIAG